MAGVTSGFTTLIADYFSGAKLNQFVGYQFGFMGIGGVIFPLAGGLLADAGWQYPFLTYLVAFVILPGILFTVNEPDLQAGSHQQGVSVDKNSLPIKTIALIYAVAFVGMIIFFMVPVQLPFYLSEVGISSSQIGLAIAVMSLVTAVGSLQYKKVKARFSFVLVSGLGFLTIGFGYIILAVTANYLSFILGLVISGFGVGLLLPNLNVWIVSVVPATVRGRAVGGLTMAISIGQFLSPFATQPITQQAGLASAFGLIGAISLFSAVTLFGIAVTKSAERATV